MDPDCEKKTGTQAQQPNNSSDLNGANHSEGVVEKNTVPETNTKIDHTYVEMSSKLATDDTHYLFAAFRSQHHAYALLSVYYDQLYKDYFEPNIRSEKEGMGSLKSQGTSWKKINRQLKWILFWRSPAGVRLKACAYLFTSCCGLRRRKLEAFFNDFEHDDMDDEAALLDETVLGSEKKIPPDLFEEMKEVSNNGHQSDDGGHSMKLSRRSSLVIETDEGDIGSQGNVVYTKG